MLKSYWIILKKHFLKNKKFNIINIVTLTLSIFILSLTININSNLDTIEQSILNSYLNNDVVEISKIKSQTNKENSFNIIKYERPNEKELSKIPYFANAKYYLNLSFLVTDYVVKIDDYIKNININFEPHFRDPNTFYYSNFTSNDIKIMFKKEILFESKDGSNYETFEFDTSKYEFKRTKYFNFLSSETIFYPYKLLEKYSKSLIIKTLDKSRYKYLSEKEANTYESGYSLLMNLKDDSSIRNFNSSKYKEIYRIQSTALESSTSFVKLLSSMLDFSSIFLSIIIIMVLTLMIFSLYYLILQNKKEIALLKSYGLKNENIKDIFRIEINVICLISIFAALFLVMASGYILNYIGRNIFYIYKIFSFRISLFSLVSFSTIIVLNILFFFPFYRINKISIREELNSL